MMKLLIACVVLVCLGASVVLAVEQPPLLSKTRIGARSCHNITGACLAEGYLCANNVYVPHAKRCDGIEDCEDGTDELLCQHDDETPIFERSAAQRHAFQQNSCVNCNCPMRTIEFSTSSPIVWWNFALHAPLDPQGLLTGSGVYQGISCSEAFTTRILMRFYKKSLICRGWLCCGRQVQCMQCSSSMDPDKRCYAA